MDEEAAEGRTEGERWREREQSHMNGADRSGMRACLTATRPVRNRTRIQLQGGCLYASSSSRIRARLMERSALGPRTSLLSLSSWLFPFPIYPPPWISYVYLLFPTSFTVYPARLSRLPTFMPTPFHIDAHTSTYFVTLHLSIHVDSFRHS